MFFLLIMNTVRTNKLKPVTVIKYSSLTQKYELRNLIVISFGHHKLIICMIFLNQHVDEMRIGHKSKTCIEKKKTKK